MKHDLSVAAVGPLGPALRKRLGFPIPPAALDALERHLETLLQWNPRAGLVRVDSPDELVSRHYAESLAAAPLLPKGPFRLLDVGSGGGFPALPILALRPDATGVLVEARRRKWAFLRAAVHRMRLSAHVVDARVSARTELGLPPFDVVTMRAVRLDPWLRIWIGGQLGSGGRLLLWAGERLPEGVAPDRAVDEIRLPESRSRRIVALPRDMLCTALPRTPA